MSADDLRAVVAEMRDKAKRATEGPWHFTLRGPDDGFVPRADVWSGWRHGWHGEPIAAHLPVGPHSCQPTAENAEHIASWHPRVAMAVAAALERFASDLPDQCVDGACDVSGCPYCGDAAALNAIAEAWR